MPAVRAGNLFPTRDERGLRMVHKRLGQHLSVHVLSDRQSEGIASQLASAGVFRFAGVVGPARASWMGSWYFVRRHPLYAGLPVNRAMSIEYQVRGSDANGLLVDGPAVEIVAAYSRDHDRKIGAGTFTAKTAASRLVFHRITGMHPVFHRRFLANAAPYLTDAAGWA